MRTLLVYLALASTLCLKAQFVITATTNPVAGDVDASIGTNTAGLTIPVSGTNILWNYSSLLLNPTAPNSATYVAISSVPNNSLFPGSTIGLSYSSGYYGVYKINSSTNDFLGSAWTSSSNCNVLSNSQTYLQIPFAYGNSYFDTYGTNYPNSIISGTVTVTADGTGTLVLPSYTITPVLKISQQYYEVQQTTTPTNTNISTTNVDAFYSGQSKFPLLTIYTTTNVQYPANTTNTYIGAKINTSFALGVGIKKFNIENSLTLFPNPVNAKHVSINFNAKNNSANISLINTLGLVVKENNYNNLPSGENKINFDLKDISTGIYYLQLKTENGEVTKKLIVE